MRTQFFYSITQNVASDDNVPPLHCEVKLFLYFQEQGKNLAHVKFGIGKPCCISCACFFFGVVHSNWPLLHSFCFTKYKESKFNITGESEQLLKETEFANGSATTWINMMLFGLDFDWESSSLLTDNIQQTNPPKCCVQCTKIN